MIVRIQLRQGRPLGRTRGKNRHFALAFGALLIAMTILRPRGLLPQPPTPMEDRAEELAEQDAERVKTVENGAVLT